LIILVFVLEITYILQFQNKYIETDHSISDERKKRRQKLSPAPNKNYKPEINSLKLAPNIKKHKTVYYSSLCVFS